MDENTPQDTPVAEGVVDTSATPVDGAPPIEATVADAASAPVTAPPAPCRWFKVEYVALAGEALPILAGGQSWQERSVHVLPEQIANQLTAPPSRFTVIGPAEPPPTPCDCGCQ